MMGRQAPSSAAAAAAATTTATTTTAPNSTRPRDTTAIASPSPSRYFLPASCTHSGHPPALVQASSSTSSDWSSLYESTPEDQALCYQITALRSKEQEKLARYSSHTSSSPSSSMKNQHVRAVQQQSVPAASSAATRGANESSSTRSSSQETMSNHDLAALYESTAEDRMLWSEIPMQEKLARYSSHSSHSTSSSMKNQHGHAVQQPSVPTASSAAARGTNESSFTRSRSLETLSNHELAVLYDSTAEDQMLWSEIPTVRSKEQEKLARYSSTMSSSSHQRDNDHQQSFSVIDGTEPSVTGSSATGRTVPMRVNDHVLEEDAGEELWMQVDRQRRKLEAMERGTDPLEASHPVAGTHSLPIAQVGIHVGQAQDIRPGAYRLAPGLNDRLDLPGRWRKGGGATTRRQSQPHDHDSDTVDAEAIDADDLKADATDANIASTTRVLEDVGDTHDCSPEAQDTEDLEDVGDTSERSPKAQDNEDGRPLFPRSVWWFVSLAALLTIIAIGVSLGSILNRSSDASTTNSTEIDKSSLSLLEQDFYNSLPEYTLAALSNSTSPQFRAFQWTITAEQPILSRERMVQRFALATLYYSINWHDTAKIRENWMKANSSECDWVGCHCTSENAMETLDLIGNRAEGTLPRELGLMNPALKKLELLSFSMFGTIPSELGHLTKLELLDLKSNYYLKGPIPTELGLLTNLRTLFLKENSLTGAVPVQLGQLSNLQELDVSRNLLNGNIPEEVCDLGEASIVVDCKEVSCDCGVQQCLCSWIS